MIPYNGEEWMDKRARLCATGFSFEYSATFGQAIKAASGAKRRIKELQSLLKRDDISLESFLLSETYRHDLRWPSPADAKKQADASAS